MKVLIVEDHKPSEILMNLAVKLMSNEIITVSTGNAAIEACHKNPDIALILMDINLAGMDGLETTRQIRQLNKQVVIIAQSALASHGIKDKAIDAGCNDFIAKPFRKKDLLAVIQKHFK
jgi:CheY-like chemotaxis protein